MPGACANRLAEQVKSFVATWLSEIQPIEPNAKIQLQALVCAPGMSTPKNDTVVAFAAALPRNKVNGAVSYGTKGTIVSASRHSHRNLRARRY